MLKSDDVLAAKRQQLDREEDTIRDVATAWVDSPENGAKLAARVANGDAPDAFTSRAAKVLKSLSPEFPAVNGAETVGYVERLGLATHWSLSRLLDRKTPQDEVAVIRRAILPTLVGRLHGFADNEQTRQLIQIATSEIAR